MTDLFYIGSWGEAAHILMMYAAILAQATQMGGLGPGGWGKGKKGDGKKAGGKGKGAPMPETSLQKELMSRVYGSIVSAAAWASRDVADMDPEWDEDKIFNRVVKSTFKTASDPKLQDMRWDDMCQELVQRVMRGLSQSCDKAAWFFQIDLSYVFFGAAWELIMNRCHEGVPPYSEMVRQFIKVAYWDKLDRILLDRAIWETVQSVFEDCDEKVHSKLFRALSCSYWAVLDEVLHEVNMEDGLLVPPLADVPMWRQRVEQFMKKWIDRSMCRVWGAIEQSERVLTHHSVAQLFLDLCTPFGVQDPFTCMPRVLIEFSGRPPPDWSFITQAVEELFCEWNSGRADGSSKKRRKCCW